VAKHKQRFRKTVSGTILAQNIIVLHSTICYTIQAKQLVQKRFPSCLCAFLGIGGHNQENVIILLIWRGVAKSNSHVEKITIYTLLYERSLKESGWRSEFHF